MDDSQTSTVADSHVGRGYVYIACATFFWGVSATLGRAAFTGRLSFHGNAITSVDPIILSQTRTTISFLLFLLVLLPRGWDALRVGRSDLYKLALLGVLGIAGANYFYYVAIQKTNVATAITVQYTAPVWVLLYMALRRYQKLTFQRLLAVTLAVVGISMAIGLFGSAKIHLDVLGIGAAILAAFSCAFYNISGHYVLERYDHWTVLLFMTMAASVFWMIIDPPWKIISAHYSGAEWVFLLGFGISSMLIPFSLYFAGLKYLDPTRAIVASCLEPVFAILIAAAFLGELVRPLQVFGIGMVLAAVITIQFPAKNLRTGN